MRAYNFEIMEWSRRNYGTWRASRLKC